EAVRVIMVAAANDPGAASGVLAPPSCGVPSGTPRRSSLRLPLSLPGSFASLAMITRTDSLAMALGLPRGWLRDTAALYARVFRRGAGLALRNWWVGLVVIVYDVLLGIVAVVTAPLGVVGGLRTYLALVACFSSWLALVAQVIQTGRIRLEDVPIRFATYLR